MLDQQLGELMTDEGLRLLVYDDATGQPIKPGTLVRGHPTIGFGRALDVHGISRDEAGALLANDIFVVESSLNKWPWFLALDPVRRGVCTNLAFNLGVQGLLSFARMIGAMQRLDFAGAAAELKASRWARQVQPSRRDRLLRQLATGVLEGAPWGNLQKVQTAAPVADNASNRPATQLPATDQVNEDNIADALNAAELNRIRGGGA